jgi:hypothetical protein
MISVELNDLSLLGLGNNKLWHRKRGEHVEGTLLKEEDVPELLARNFSSRKKWMILHVIAFLQISMNLNASIFGSANHTLRERYGMSELMCRMFQGFFLIAYAFG